jgi:hypothetical protein
MGQNFPTIVAHICDKWLTTLVIMSDIVHFQNTYDVYNSMTCRPDAVQRLGKHVSAETDSE